MFIGARYSPASALAKSCPKNILLSNSPLLLTCVSLNDQVGMVVSELPNGLFARYSNKFLDALGFGSVDSFVVICLARKRSASALERVTILP